MPAELPEGGVFAYDPWLYSENQAKVLRKAVEGAGGRLEAAGENPLDAVWPDQPAPPAAPILPHDLRYCRPELSGKAR